MPSMHSRDLRVCERDGGADSARLLSIQLCESVHKRYSGLLKPSFPAMQNDYENGKQSISVPPGAVSAGVESRIV